jgi:aspartate/tyrosine/aromatic aminotransferase
MPLTTQVYKNVDNFIRRAGMMGYIGENKDKVSDTQRSWTVFDRK